MCILVEKVTQVKGTNILVAVVKLSTGERKGLVVYQNFVEFSEASRPGGMILPVPNANKAGIRVLRLEDEKEMSMANEKKACAQLFAHLKRLSEPPKAQTRGSRGGDFSFGMAKSAMLEVHKVGSFAYSFAPDCESLPRLQAGELGLEPEGRHKGVMNFVKCKYPRSFGFLVFHLTSGTSMLPFAYLSDLQSDGSVFVPTMHYHEHPTEPKSFTFDDLKPSAFGGDLKPSAFGGDSTSVSQKQKKRYIVESTDATGDELVTSVFGPRVSVAHSVAETQVAMQRPTDVGVDWDHHIYTLDGSLRCAAGSTTTRLQDQYALQDVWTILGVKDATLRKVAVSCTTIDSTSGYERNHDVSFLPSISSRYCDVCHYDITRTATTRLYRCYECDDFDMCIPCHDKHEHHEHPLMEMDLVMPIPLSDEKLTSTLVVWKNIRTAKEVPAENDGIRQLVFTMGQAVTSLNAWFVVGNMGVAANGAPSPTTSASVLTELIDKTKTLKLNTAQFYLVLNMLGALHRGVPKGTLLDVAKTN